MAVRVIFCVLHVAAKVEMSPSSKGTLGVCLSEALRRGVELRGQVAQKFSTP